MLKLVGMAGIVAGAWLMGFAFAGKTKQRVEELENSIAALELLKQQLRYTLAPIDRLLMRLVQHPQYGQLPFLQQSAQLCAQGTPFEEAFTTALHTSPGQLQKDDTYAMLPLAQVLGSVEAASQISALDLSLGLLGRRLENAYTDKQKHYRMYSTLGFLAGVGIVIILI